MYINEAIRKIMNEYGITQTELGNRLGYSGQSEVAARLQTKNMTTNNVVKFLNAIGCELVIRDTISGQTYVVDQTEDV